MRRILTTLLFAIAYCTPTLAQDVHTDLEIEIEGNSLATDPRVAEGEFGENPTEPNVADEPGFEVDDGVFTANQPLGFDVAATEIGGVARNLWFWNGTGAVAFGAAPHDLVVQHPLVDALNTRLDSSEGASSKPGFQIGQGDDEGGIHQDVEFILVDPDGVDVSPTAGVYLFGLEMSSDGFANSDPAYFVLASGIEEESHELAAIFVETNVVPEPNSAVSAMIGLLALLGLRRIGVSR